MFEDINSHGNGIRYFAAQHELIEERYIIGGALLLEGPRKVVAKFDDPALCQRVTNALIETRNLSDLQLKAGVVTEALSCVDPMINALKRLRAQLNTKAFRALFSDLSYEEFKEFKEKFPLDTYLTKLVEEEEAEEEDDEVIFILPPSPSDAEALAQVASDALSSVESHTYLTAVGANIVKREVLLVEDAGEKPYHDWVVGTTSDPQLANRMAMCTNVLEGFPDEELEAGLPEALIAFYEAAFPALVALRDECSEEAFRARFAHLDDADFLSIRALLNTGRTGEELRKDARDDYEFVEGKAD